MGIFLSLKARIAPFPLTSEREAPVLILIFQKFQDSAGEEQQLLCLQVLEAVKKFSGALP